MTEAALDKDGFLLDLTDWNEQTAQWLADRDAVKLTEAHWSVLRVLRDFYQRTEVSPAMRAFVKLVRDELGADCGNSIYLMELFGESPAKTAAKWAGLPRPTNCL